MPKFKLEGLEVGSEHTVEQRQQKKQHPDKVLHENQQYQQQLILQQQLQHEERVDELEQRSHRLMKQMSNPLATHSTTVHEQPHQQQRYHQVQQKQQEEQDCLQLLPWYHGNISRDAAVRRLIGFTMKNG